MSVSQRIDERVLTGKLKSETVKSIESIRLTAQNTDGGLTYEEQHSL